MRSASSSEAHPFYQPRCVCAATFVGWGSKSHHTRRSASRWTTIPHHRLSPLAATGKTDTESPWVESRPWTQAWQICPHESAWKPPGLDEGCPDYTGRARAQESCFGLYGHSGWQASTFAGLIGVTRSDLARCSRVLKYSRPVGPPRLFCLRLRCCTLQNPKPAAPTFLEDRAHENLRR